MLSTVCFHNDSGHVVPDVAQHEQEPVWTCTSCAAWCWAVSTGWTRGYQALAPPDWVHVWTSLCKIGQVPDRVLTCYHYSFLSTLSFTCCRMGTSPFYLFLLHRSNLCVDAVVIKRFLNRLSSVFVATLCAQLSVCVLQEQFVQH